MNRVLLTGVYGPQGTTDESKSVGTELFHKHPALARDFFSVR